MKHFWLSVIAVAALSGCSPGTPVIVTNNSAFTVESVVISGSGFSHALGTIAPGQSVSAGVDPRGESGLRVAFRAGTRQVRTRPQGYFEGGGAYKVRAVIAPDLSVQVTGDLKY